MKDVKPVRQKAGTRPRRGLTPTGLKQWAEAIAFALVLGLAIVQQAANTVLAIQGRKPPFATPSVNSLDQK